MALGYYVPHRRDENAVRADSQVLRSADGNRTANGRNMKASRGNGVYDIVTAWNLRERINGRLVTFDYHRSEQEAEEWVLSGKESKYWLTTWSKPNQK